MSILHRFSREYPVPAFFGLTFLIAWFIWLPLGLLAPERVLLTLPGAWAPTAAALILIGLGEGRRGIAAFLRQLLRWRVGWGWYGLVLLGIAALAYLAIALGVVLGVPPPEPTLPAGLPRQALLVYLPVLFLVNIFVGGPLAEDIGWRGYILPKMREQMGTLQASLLIGLIWAVWHLPYFMFPGWHAAVGGLPFAWFTLLTTGWSVLFAWVYINTSSLLMPVLFHAAINTTLGTLGILGSGEEHLLSLVLNTLLTWIAVGVVIALDGPGLDRRRPGAKSATP